MGGWEAAAPPQVEVVDLSSLLVFHRRQLSRRQRTTEQENPKKKKGQIAQDHEVQFIIFVRPATGLIFFDSCETNLETHHLHLSCPLLHPFHLFPSPASAFDCFLRHRYLSLAQPHQRIDD